MYYQLNDAIFDHPTLVGREKIVLLAIARHVNGPGELAWPSIRTIAEAAGLKRSHVCRIIKGLTFKGVLVVTESGGPRKPSKYDLSVLMSQQRGHKDQQLCPIEGDITEGGGGVLMSPKSKVMSPPGTLMSHPEGTESSKSQPKKNQGSPPAFMAEATRLLKAMTADCRPAFADQDYLREAAGGNAKAWQSFRGSINTQTRRFMELHLTSNQQQETA